MTYLEEPEYKIQCSKMRTFINKIVEWLAINNPRVAQNGLVILTNLINRKRVDFKPYINSIIPMAFDRLGDNKEAVKTSANQLLNTLMECDIVLPRGMFDKLTKALSHRSSIVKEQLLMSDFIDIDANGPVRKKVHEMLITLYNSRVRAEGI